MRAMERLIDEGQIRFAGVSNFDVEQVRAAQAALRHHKLASNQVLYHLRERGIERKLIPYCQEQGIALVAYTPFGRAKFPRPDSPGGRVLEEIAKRHGRTVRQVIPLHHSTMPLASFLPTVMRNGTPIRSASLNFTPGRSSRSSSRASSPSARHSP
jgi:diketogulonate reductase-like aldo/keto reductase